MRLCSIASGSSGNCIYTGTDDTHLLVDAGVSAKKIEAGLKDLELEGHDIQGLLNGVHRIKHTFLVFLQILVIGKWQGLHNG